MFGRSVTFHLQKEFSDRPEFDSWYASWQAAITADAICKFFVQKRNFILKQGRVHFNYTLSVQDALISTSFAHVELKVIRPRPWYRRPVLELWQDAARPVREWKRKRQAQRDRRARAAAERVSRPCVPPVIGFVGFRPDESALKVLGEYIDFLDRIVSDAEARFV